MSSDLVTNQISLLNSYPNPAHRKYERFACTIRIGLKYLSTSIVNCNRMGNVDTWHEEFSEMRFYPTNTVLVSARVVLTCILIDKILLPDKPRGRGRPVREDFGDRRPPRDGGNKDNAPRERRENRDRPERFGDRFGERTDRTQNEFRYERVVTHGQQQYVVTYFSTFLSPKSQVVV